MPPPGTVEAWPVGGSHYQQPLTLPHRHGGTVRLAASVPATTPAIDSVRDAVAHTIKANHARSRGSRRLVGVPAASLEGHTTLDRAGQCRCHFSIAYARTMSLAGTAPEGVSLVKPFAELLDRLLYSPQRNVKIALILDYFRSVPDPDRGWGLAALTGALSFAQAKPGMIRELMSSRTDPVLFGWSYDFVGDLAETAALIGRNRRASAPGRRWTRSWPTLGTARKASCRRSLPTGSTGSMPPAAGRCSSW